MLGVRKKEGAERRLTVDLQSLCDRGINFYIKMLAYF